MMEMRKSLQDNEFRNIRQNSGMCDTRYCNWPHNVGIAGYTAEHNQQMTNDRVRYTHLAESLYPCQPGLQLESMMGFDHRYDPMNLAQNPFANNPDLKGTRMMEHCNDKFSHFMGTPHSHVTVDENA
jgi:hypothetical protein